MRILPLSLMLGACRIGAALAQPVPPLALTPEQLGTLPQHQVTLTFGTPPAPHSFQGPLLWDVLTASGTIDPARHADTVRQWVQIRARDGYTAILALGEVSPDFENKPAIVATQMDTRMLDLPRLVVPNDRRAGRSARDVVGLSVETLPAPVR